MKNIKQWLADKLPKHTHTFPLPIADRVELKHNFFALDDQNFLTVHIATEEDIEAIISIEQLCYSGQTPWNRSALLHEIRYNKNAFYIVVTDDQTPVAFLGTWFVSEEAHITNIATIPAYESKGIATFLITELKRIALSEAIKIISLEVRISNQRAQRLYRKMKFENGRIKKGYYINDHEDALEMAMILGE
ncbi:ribosomal protein S18-alanine N-acetyltransferase [Marinilactibacillus psychrotolerans]|uniref:Ribosomal protein S18-alanine N-acetyltransferase n=2 Tax=Marinilactibacillus psychrotolerans TaxID=191770 RepID=A0ABW8UIX4_9LACT|nr:ribosomal protein S18-alanine N-acetyltransferase [Marinilactibacillus psychrotolerans]GEQ33254.1 ribosomal-protein-alanine acetyltransferase [Marinilactibacillus psychrotolerans]SJN30727.1 Ribosomal-protein-S18p-alanine acetyltransferase [Marinilactibacillus psychrotolerans 42ea]